VVGPLSFRPQNAGKSAFAMDGLVSRPSQLHEARVTALSGNLDREK
jgi:hypothetical protein